MRICFATILAIGLTGTAQAQAPSVSATSDAAQTSNSGNWNRSSGGRGTLGVHRVEAAHGLGAGELVLTIGGAWFSTKDFIVDGDTNERQTQELTIVWAPIEQLELYLRQRSLTNNNSAFEPGTIQVLGDPTFGVKVPFAINDSFAAGLNLDLLIPTSPGGRGLKPNAFRLTALALASYAAAPWLEVSLNAGYAIDNTGDVFKREIEHVQRFAAGISKSNAIIAGLGIATDFTVADLIGVGPFAEVHAAIGGSASSDAPMRATGGIKVYPANHGLMEIAVGGDFRIGGEPSIDNDFPGLAPWELFARVTAHLSTSAEPTLIAASGPTSCSADTDCTAGETCHEGICSVVKEVIKEVTTEVVKEQPTFVVTGAVFDQDSGDPISSATVAISGSESSALAVDPQTGEFKSFPLASGEGLVQLKAEAPGYRPTESTMPKGAAGESKAVTLKLQSLGKDATGEVRGNLKDSRSGKPLRAQVFVPVLNKKLKANAEGKFEATLKAGRYQVLISSRGYITQKKEIDIRPGDVVILNIDLSPKRK